MRVISEKLLAAQEVLCFNFLWHFIYCCNFIRALLFPLPYIFIIFYFTHFLYILFLSAFHLLPFQCGVFTFRSWHFHSFALNPCPSLRYPMSPSLFLFLSYFCSQQMQTTRFSKTSERIYQTTRRHIPEDCNFILISVRTLGLSVFITVKSFGGK